jgi:hypothetical protein
MLMKSFGPTRVKIGYKEKKFQALENKLNTIERETNCVISFNSDYCCKLFFLYSEHLYCKPIAK